MELYLLGKDDARNFEVLTHILHQGDFKTTKSDLMNNFNLSTYKLEKTVNSLNTDLIQVSSTDAPAKIVEISRGIFQAQNLNNAIIHDLGSVYLRRSVIFMAFEYRFIYQYQYTKVSYLAKLFLSNSPFYEAEEKLDQLLISNEFYESLNSNGREFTIRQRLFQIYFETFPNTTQFEYLNPITSDVVSELDLKFQFELSHTRFLKLKSFLKLWLLRIQARQFVEDDNSNFKDNYVDNQRENLSFVIEIIEKYLTFPLPPAEVNYLYSFLLISEYLDFNLDYHDEFPKEYQLSTKLITKIYENQTIADYSRINKKPLFENLMLVNLSLRYFYIEPTSFVSRQQIASFEANYPLFSRIVHEFITQTYNNSILTAKMETNLYLSHLFVLLNIIPMKIMVTPIYIYLDFSLGKLYTDYLETRLNDNFRNTNVMIQRTMNENTDLYLSDLPSNLIQMPQVIWENPPTPTDWTFLEHEVAKIKALEDNKYKPQ